MSSTYDFANNIVDHLTGKAAYTPPSPIYLALFSTSVDRFGNATEITGGGYERIETSASDWSSADLGQSRNLIDFTFGPASSDWGKVFAVGIVGPTDNILVWKALSKAPFRVNEGATLVIDEDDFVISVV